MKVKTKRILALTVALLCLATALAACSSKSTENIVEENVNTPNTLLLDNVFNSAFNLSDNKITSTLSLPSLGVIQPSSNEYFSIFKDANTTYIYSNIENSVIHQLDMLKGTTESEYQATNIKTYMEDYVIPLKTPSIYAVIRYGAYDDNIAYSAELGAYIPQSSGKYEVTVEFFDTAGVTLHTISSEEVLRDCPDPLNIVNYIESLICTFYGDTNLISIGSSVMSLSSHTGRATSLNTFEAGSIPAFTMMSANYFYVLDSSSYTVSIYDIYLEKAAAITLPPKLFEDSVIVFPLQNGNLLFQCQKPLPYDATEYDLIKHSEDAGVDTALKYDVDTTLVDIYNCNTREVNTNFVILEHLYSFSTLDKITDTTYYSEMYNSSIDTIVKVAYLDESKVLSTAPSHTDVVALSNDGTIQRSLILNEEWLSVPAPIGGGFYDVTTVSGESNTVSKDGSVIFTYNPNKTTNIGKLSITSNAIYDRTTGVSVFELSEQHTVINNIHSKAIFITEITSDGNTLLHAVFANGTVDALGIIDGPGKNIDLFSIAEFGGYYIIKKTDSTDYSYFNEYGQTLITSSIELSCISKTFNGYILTNTHTDEYFHFTTEGYALPNLYISKN